jgi:hypothetical protein
VFLVIHILILPAAIHTQVTLAKNSKGATAEAGVDEATTVLEEEALQRVLSFRRQPLLKVQDTVFDD